MFKVVVGTLWHEGKKYKRGDVIDKDYGTGTEAYIEPKKPKRRAKKVVVNEDSRDD